MKRFSLLRALRYKWTMLAVFVLLAGPAIAVIWIFTVPKYTAKGEIRVRPIIPRLVFQTEDNGMIPLYQTRMSRRQLKVGWRLRVHVSQPFASRQPFRRRPGTTSVSRVVYSP